MTPVTLNIWHWSYHPHLGGGVRVAGVSRDVGASLQCLDIGSNNLLRNVCSRHSAVVVSIISADPSSHTPSPQLRTLNGIDFGPCQ